MCVIYSGPEGVLSGKVSSKNLLVYKISYKKRMLMFTSTGLVLEGALEKVTVCC